MRISLDAWSTAGLAIFGSACLVIYAGNALGLPTSLGSPMLLASIATLFGRDAYSAKSDASDKSGSKLLFWLFVVAVALEVWHTLA